MSSAVDEAVPIATLEHFIGGRFVVDEDGDFGDVYDPATGRISARVPMADDDLTRKAIAAATEALPGWSGMPALRRARVLFRFRELVE
jgi:malonate-semialdehyde dehydrogenase (acetylating)/methylmalonate-semialdehyde dehydrogenase